VVKLKGEFLYFCDAILVAKCRVRCRWLIKKVQAQKLIMTALGGRVTCWTAAEDEEDEIKTGVSFFD